MSEAEVAVRPIATSAGVYEIVIASAATLASEPARQGPMPSFSDLGINDRRLGVRTETDSTSAGVNTHSLAMSSPIRKAAKNRA